MSSITHEFKPIYIEVTTHDEGGFYYANEIRIRFPEPVEPHDFDIVPFIPPFPHPSQSLTPQK